MHMAHKNPKRLLIRNYRDTCYLWCALQTASAVNSRKQLWWDYNDGIIKQDYYFQAKIAHRFHFTEFILQIKCTKPCARSCSRRQQPSRGRLAAPVPVRARRGRRRAGELEAEPPGPRRETNVHVPSDLGVWSHAFVFFQRGQKE